MDEGEMLAGGEATTVVTVVHGTHHDCVAGWIAHLRATGCRAALHVIVLDATEPRFDDPALTVERIGLANPQWGEGDYVRLRRIRELCNAGRTCLQVDLDCYFHVDPTTYAALPYPFVISRGLGFPDVALKAWGFSLCTGFYIAKPAAMPLLDAWLALQPGRRGLDQEDLNLHLVQAGVTWRHAVSPLVTDAFVVSTDERIAVLSDRAVTRNPGFDGFGGIHNRSVLGLHRAAPGTGS